MVKNKVLKIIVLAMLIFMLFNNYVYADPMDINTPEKLEEYNSKHSSDPSINPNYWDPTIITEDDSNVTKIVGKILGVINVIGVVASVIAIAIIGIKYMIGSVEEKADYKQEMVPYIIGAFLTFSVTTIPNIIYNVVYGLGWVRL